MQEGEVSNVSHKYFPHAVPKYFIEGARYINAAEPMTGEFECVLVQLFECSLCTTALSVGMLEVTEFLLDSISDL